MTAGAVCADAWPHSKVAIAAIAGPVRTALPPLDWLEWVISHRRPRPAPARIHEVTSVWAYSSSASSRAWPRPVSNWRTEASKRAAFFGLFGRRAVCCHPANSSSDKITMLPLPPWRLTRRQLPIVRHTIEPARHVLTEIGK